MHTFYYCCGWASGLGMGLIAWGFHDAVTNPSPVGLLPTSLVVGIVLSVVALSSLFLFVVLGE